MSKKFDLFFVLKELDKNNLKIYESFENEEDLKKEIDKLLSWLLPQWMSASSNDDVEKFLTERVNFICNKSWFKIRNHPKLQAKLLSSCGPGKPIRHRYVKKHHTSSVPNIRILLEAGYPDIKEEEIILWCKKNSPQQVKEFAEENGYQQNEVDEIMKEYKKVTT